jgi:hypothetical protein
VLGVVHVLDGVVVVPHADGCGATVIALWDFGVVHSCGKSVASWLFTRRAKDSGLLPTTGSIGYSYDNAMMEPFWTGCGPSVPSDPVQRHDHPSRDGPSPARLGSSVLAMETRWLRTSLVRLRLARSRRQRLNGGGTMSNTPK